MTTIKKIQPKNKKKYLEENKDIIKLKDDLGNSKRFFSASKIGLFLTCPLKYKYKYIDKIKTDINAPSLTMGTAVHKCMEYIYDCKASGVKVDKKIIDNIIKESLDRNYCPDMDDIQWEEFCEYTKKLIYYYNSKKRKHKPLVVEGKVCSEVDFEMPFNDPVTGENKHNIYLRGSIDLISDDLKIIDFKTAARAYSLAKVDSSIQMTVYSYIFRQMFGVEEEEIMFDIIIKKQKTKSNPDGTPELRNFRTKRTERDYIKLYRLIEAIIKAEDNNVFYPSYPSEGTWCNYCDYSEYCEKWNG